MQHAKNLSPTESPRTAKNIPVLIYDGECPICGRTVEWIRARMAPDAFEFLSCHSDNLTARFPRIKKDACLRAMHLVLPDGSIIIGERAVPEILQRIRGYRWAAALFRLPGTGIFSRIFYRWFAKNRFHISRALSPGRPPI